MCCPWVDVLRIVIYVLGFVIIGLSARAMLAHGMWRRPWAGDNAGYFAYTLLVIVQARARLQALNDGGLPEVWPTVLVLISMVLAVVWLGRRVVVTSAWYPHWGARRTGPRDCHQHATPGDEKNTEDA